MPHPEAVAGPQRAGPVRQDVPAALGLFAVGTLLLALGATGSYSSVPHPLPDSSPWFLLPLLCVCAAGVLPRRLPLTAIAVATAALVADALLGGSIATIIAFTNVLYGGYAGTTPRRRRAVEETAVVVVVAGAAAVGIAGGSVGDVVGVLLSGAGIALVPVWWARDVVRQAQVAHVAERNSALLADQVVREERSAMARDLHDTVAGHLAAIALQSEAALAAARRRGEDTAALQGIRAASVESLREMRTLIQLLRSGAPPEATVAARGLDAVVATVDLARAGGLDVRADVAADLGDVAPATGQAVHRVVQESLTNARKHAGPGVVEVSLRRRGADLLLDVVSPAVPRAGGAAPPPGPGGHGLVGMRERLHVLGGRFSAGPEADGRWRVRAELPARLPHAAGAPR